MEKIEEVPVIDWQLYLKLSNHDSVLAKKILDAYIRDLTENFEQIQPFYQQSNFEALGEVIHKMHGASYYGGVPELTKIIAHFQVMIKSNRYDNFSEIFAELDSHVTKILNCYKTMYST